MHGYATINMPVPGPQNCCRHGICSARPQNEHSPWKFHSQDVGKKAKQNSARNNTKCSKYFQFLCNNNDRTWFFNALTFARSRGRCWKPRPSTSVFNISHGTWRMLMHEKTMFDPYNIMLYETWLIEFEPCIERFEQSCLFSALLFLDYLRLSQQSASFGRFMSVVTR